MSRFLLICSAILMLALVVTVPAVAETPDAQAEPAVTEDVPVNLDLAEEPLMTPAEPAEVPDVFDPEGFKRVNKFRLCDEREAQAHCPPGCDCFFVSNSYRCFCF